MKWVDPKVYRMYLRLKYRRVTPEQIEKDAESFYKLKAVIVLNDILDKLEERGFIEVINDYENEQILVKENQNYTRR